MDVYIYRSEQTFLPWKSIIEVFSYSGRKLTNTGDKDLLAWITTAARTGMQAIAFNLAYWPDPDGCHSSPRIFKGSLIKWQSNNNKPHQAPHLFEDKSWKPARRFRGHRSLLSKPDRLHSIPELMQRWEESPSPNVVLQLPSLHHSVCPAHIQQ